MKKFTNWKHQQIIIQLTHSVLFYGAANWYIGALVYWHIIKLAHGHINQLFLWKQLFILFP